MEELKSWKGAKEYIKLIDNASLASDMLFKLTVYHSMSETLPKNWFIDCKE